MTMHTAADTTIVECDGELVRGESVEEFRQAVAAVLEPGRTVLVNLEAVTKIDCAALGALAALASLAHARGVPVILCGARGLVRKMLQITGLNRAFATKTELQRAICAA